MTPFRRGLDWLLATHPDFDLLDATIPGRSIGQPSPWLLVVLGQPSEGEQTAYAIHRYAIFKNTGAVHLLGSDGAVSDDPVYVPGNPDLSLRPRPGESAADVLDRVTNAARESPRT
jgi:hypothetical protein